MSETPCKARSVRQKAATSAGMLPAGAGSHAMYLPSGDNSKLISGLTAPISLTHVRMLSAGAGSNSEHGPRAVGGRAGARAAPQPRERCLPPSWWRFWREVQPGMPRRRGSRRRRAQATATGEDAAILLFVVMSLGASDEIRT